jgi:hypothetical protein
MPRQLFRKVWYISLGLTKSKWLFGLSDAIKMLVSDMKKELTL